METTALEGLIIVRSRVTYRSLRKISRKREENSLQSRTYFAVSSGVLSRKLPKLVELCFPLVSRKKKKNKTFTLQLRKRRSSTFRCLLSSFFSQRSTNVRLYRFRNVSVHVAFGRNLRETSPPRILVRLNFMPDVPAAVSVKPLATLATCFVCSCSREVYGFHREDSRGSRSRVSSPRGHHPPE